MNWLTRLLHRVRAQRLSLGQRGERLARRFLRKKGFTIVARNWSDSLGELDIVAVDQRTVVFIEVKTWGRAEESPASAVDDEKQRRLTRVALRYLKRYNLLECEARFDVVAIHWRPDHRPVVEHIVDAFRPVGSGQFFA